MPGLPISFQGLNLPMTDTLRLNLITQHVKLNPLQYFDIVDLPAGTSGMHFFSALAVESGNENFLEGRYSAKSQLPSPPQLIFSLNISFSQDVIDIIAHLIKDIQALC